MIRKRVRIFREVDPVVPFVRFGTVSELDLAVRNRFADDFSQLAHLIIFRVQPDIEHLVVHDLSG